MSGPAALRRAPGPRWVFVCGLHRTGTSLLARLLAAHPAIAAIEGAQVPEGEGAYLQGAIPHTALHGVPGHYATDAAQHLVEGCRYDTLAARERLLADWGPWFGASAAWRLEKSPVNLVRMRLYQQLFPMAHFVVIVRHPEAMAAALAKWSERAAGELIDYALDAYALAFTDLAHLHCAAMVRYEDLVAAPGKQLARLLRFLALAPVSPGEEVHDANRDYLGVAEMDAAQAARAAQWGYAPGLRVEAWDAPLRHPLRSVREAAES